MNNNQLSYLCEMFYINNNISNEDKKLYIQMILCDISIPCKIILKNCLAYHKHMIKYKNVIFGDIEKI